MPKFLPLIIKGWATQAASKTNPPAEATIIQTRMFRSIGIIPDIENLAEAA
jgi:hypothetical protein